MSSGFAVSTVVISKETPLHDPVKTFRAAIDAALDPGRAPGVLADSAASLDPDTPRYAELSRWVDSPASGLDERFAATLLCHERLRGGEVPGSDETVDAFVRFWGGGPLRVRADFRDAGQVPLDVSREHRNPGARKPLSHHLQRNRLSRSGRARHQSMPIGKRKCQPGRLLTFADKNLFNGIGGLDIRHRYSIAFMVHVNAPHL